MITSANPNDHAAELRQIDSTLEFVSKVLTDPKRNLRDNSRFHMAGNISGLLARRRYHRRILDEMAGAN